MSQGNVPEKSEGQTRAEAQRLREQAFEKKHGQPYPASRVKPRLPSTADQLQDMAIREEISSNRPSSNVAHQLRRHWDESKENQYSIREMTEAVLSMNATVAKGMDVGIEMGHAITESVLDDTDRIMDDQEKFDRARGTVLEQFPHVLQDIETIGDFRLASYKVAESVRRHEALASMGWAGMALGFVAAVPSVENVIPVAGLLTRTATMYRASRAAMVTANAGRFGAATAAEAGLATAAAEGVHMSLNPQQTVDETLRNVAIGTAIGGVFGTTIGAFATPTYKKTFMEFTNFFHPRSIKERYWTSAGRMEAMVDRLADGADLRRFIAEEPKALDMQIDVMKQIESEMEKDPSRFTARERAAARLARKRAQLARRHQERMRNKKGLTQADRDAEVQDIRALIAEEANFHPDSPEVDDLLRVYKEAEEQAYGGRMAGTNDEFDSILAAEYGEAKALELRMELGIGDEQASGGIEALANYGGLGPHAVGLLHKAGIRNVSQLHEAINTKAGLQAVDGIGPATEAKILAAIEADEGLRPISLEGAPKRHPVSDLPLGADVLVDPALTDVHGRIGVMKERLRRIWGVRVVHRASRKQRQIGPGETVGIAATSNPHTREIEIDLKLIDDMWERGKAAIEAGQEPPWRQPQVAGVEPLEMTFNTKDELYEFVLAHEMSHVERPTAELLAEADQRGLTFANDAEKRAYVENLTNRHAQEYIQRARNSLEKLDATLKRLEQNGSYQEATGVTDTGVAATINRIIKKLGIRIQVEDDLLTKLGRRGIDIERVSKYREARAVATFEESQSVPQARAVGRTSEADLLAEGLMRDGVTPQELRALEDMTLRDEADSLNEFFATMDQLAEVDPAYHSMLEALDPEDAVKAVEEEAPAPPPQRISTQPKSEKAPDNPDEVRVAPAAEATANEIPAPEPGEGFDLKFVEEVHNVISVAQRKLEAGKDIRWANLKGFEEGLDADQRAYFRKKWDALEAQFPRDKPKVPREPAAHPDDGKAGGDLDTTVKSQQDEALAEAEASDERIARGLEQDNAASNDPENPDHQDMTQLDRARKNVETVRRIRDKEKKGSAQWKRLNESMERLERAAKALERDAKTRARRGEKVKEATKASRQQPVNRVPTPKDGPKEPGVGRVVWAKKLPALAEIDKNPDTIYVYVDDWGKVDQSLQPGNKGGRLGALRRRANTRAIPIRDVDPQTGEPIPWSSTPITGEDWRFKNGDRFRNPDKKSWLEDNPDADIKIRYDTDQKVYVPEKLHATVREMLDEIPPIIDDRARGVMKEIKAKYGDEQEKLAKQYFESKEAAASTSTGETVKVARHPAYKYAVAELMDDLNRLAHAGHRIVFADDFPAGFKEANPEFMDFLNTKLDRFHELWAEKLFKPTRNKKYPSGVALKRWIAELERRGAERSGRAHPYSRGQALSVAVEMGPVGKGILPGRLAYIKRSRRNLSPGTRDTGGWTPVTIQSVGGWRGKNSVQIISQDGQSFDFVPIDQLRLALDKHDMPIYVEPELSAATMRHKFRNSEDWDRQFNSGGKGIHRRDNTNEIFWGQAAGSSAPVNPGLIKRQGANLDKLFEKERTELADILNQLGRLPGPHDHRYDMLKFRESVILEKFRAAGAMAEYRTKSLKGIKKLDNDIVDLQREIDNRLANPELAEVPKYIKTTIQNLERALKKTTDKDKIAKLEGILAKYRARRDPKTLELRKDLARLVAARENLVLSTNRFEIEVTLQRADSGTGKTEPAYQHEPEIRAEKVVGSLRGGLVPEGLTREELARSIDLYNRTHEVGTRQANLDAAREVFDAEQLRRAEEAAAELQAMKDRGATPEELKARQQEHLDELAEERKHFDAGIDAETAAYNEAVENAAALFERGQAVERAQADLDNLQRQIRNATARGDEGSVVELQRRAAEAERDLQNAQSQQPTEEAARVAVKRVNETRKAMDERNERRVTENEPMLDDEVIELLEPIVRQGPDKVKVLRKAGSRVTVKKLMDLLPREPTDPLDAKLNMTGWKATRAAHADESGNTSLSNLWEMDDNPALADPESIANDWMDNFGEDAVAQLEAMSDMDDSLPFGGFRGHASDLKHGARQAILHADDMTREYRGRAREKLLGHLDEDGTLWQEYEPRGFDQEEQIRSALGVEQLLKISPGGRLALSNFTNSRIAAQYLSDTSIGYLKNSHGMPTGDGIPSAESRAMVWMAPFGNIISDMPHDWAAMRMGNHTGKKRDFAALIFNDWRTARQGREVEGLTWTKFRSEVGKTIASGEEHPEPVVNQYAKRFREEMFKPFLRNAQDVGLLSRDIPPEFIEKYLPRLWIHEKVKQNQNAFTRDLVRALRKDNPELTDEDALVLATDEYKRATNKAGGRMQYQPFEHRDLKFFQQRMLRFDPLDMAQWLEFDIDSIGRFYSRTVGADIEVARRFRRARSMDKVDRPKLDENGRPVLDANGQKVMENVDPEYRAKGYDYIQNDLQPRIEQLRALHDNQRAQLDAAGTAATEADLHNHTVTGEALVKLIDEDRLIRAVLAGPDKDGNIGYNWQDLATIDVESPGGKILMDASEADFDLTLLRRSLKEEAQEKINDGQWSRLQRHNIAREYTRDLVDLDGMIGILRGTLSAPGDPDAMLPRIAYALRRFNFMTMGGSFHVSAMVDPARVIQTQGLAKTFKYSIIPFVNSFQDPALKAAYITNRKEMKKWAIGLEVVLNGRAATAYDLGGDWARHTKLEQFIRRASDQFATVSLQPQWNDLMKSWAGTVVSQNIIEMSQAVRAGTATVKDVRTLAQLRINVDMAKRIADHIQTHSNSVDAGGYRFYPIENTERWDTDVAEALMTAIRSETDKAIVTPGIGDVPLMSSGRGLPHLEKAVRTMFTGDKNPPVTISPEILRLMFQFKRFSLASTTRVLVAGLQERDAAWATGMAMALGLGIMVHNLKAGLGGYPAGDWRQQVKAGVERSGQPAIVSDFNAFVSLGTRGNLSAGNILGGTNSDAFTSRTMTDLWAGPWWSQVKRAGTTAATAGKLATFNPGAISQRDIRQFRQLWIGQNVSYLDWLFDGLEGGLNAAVKATR